MLSILNQLKSELCSVCAVGTPPEILGYKASGNCMDYVFDTFKTPYSVAWEIYTNEKQFKEMNDYINKLKSNPNNKNNKKAKNKNLKNPLYNKVVNIGNPNNKSFLESSAQVYLKAQSYRRLMKARDFSESENKMCFKLFNPDNKESYDYIIKTWRKVSFY